MSDYLVEKEIVNECITTAEKFNQSDEVRIFKKANEMLNDQLVGTIYFAGTDMKALIKYAKRIIGSPELDKLSVSFVNRDYEVIFTYGESNNVSIGAKGVPFTKCDMEHISDNIKEFLENETSCVQINLCAEKLRQHRVIAKSLKI